MSTPDETHEDIGALIRSATAEVRAPASLRAEVDALTAPRRRARPRRFGLAAVGTAAAALAAVLVLVLGGSTPGGPTLADAATAALQPVSGPAPAAASPALLSASIDGISFPAWRRQFGLRATGARD